MLMWDCPECGSQGNLTDLICPNCGASRRPEPTGPEPDILSALTVTEPEPE